jgi:hypothetical protein
MTCKRYRSLCQSLWNVDKLYSRFVRDTARFITLLRRYNAVVLGDIVSRFLARDARLDRDGGYVISIYVDDSSPDSEGVAELINYFVENEGYWRYASYIRQSVDFGAVRNMRKDVGGLFRTIQVCGTRHCDPLSCYIGGYSDLLMSFLTWNKAYCLFPQTLLVDGVVVPKFPNRLNRLELTETRAVGDRFTWIVPLCGPTEADGEAVEEPRGGLFYRCSFELDGFPIGSNIILAMVLLSCKCDMKRIAYSLIMTE